MEVSDGPSRLRTKTSQTSSQPSFSYENINEPAAEVHLLMQMETTPRWYSGLMTNHPEIHILLVQPSD